jgi:hypothetical protein
MDRTIRFDVVRSNCVTVPSMTLARQQHSMIPVNREVFVLGGYN